MWSCPDCCNWPSFQKCKKQLSWVRSCLASTLLSSHSLGLTFFWPVFSAEKLVVVFSDILTQLPSSLPLTLLEEYGLTNSKFLKYKWLQSVYGLCHQPLSSIRQFFLRSSSCSNGRHRSLAGWRCIFSSLVMYPVSPPTSMSHYLGNLWKWVCIIGKKVGNINGYYIDRQVGKALGG